MPILPYHADRHAAGQRRRQACRAGISRGALALLLLPALFLLAACSTASRDRALRFFFDGVPPRSNALPAELTPGPAAPRPAARQWTASVHRPYAEFQCAKCHSIVPRGLGGGGVPTFRTLVIKRPDEGLCAACHRGIPGEPAFAHAPVLLSACMWCHQPHESRFPALLRAAPADVCLRCHWEEELSSGDHHLRPFASSARSCIDCHAAHGGERRFFLKQAPEPAGAPANGGPAAEPVPQPPEPAPSTPPAAGTPPA